MSADPTLTALAADLVRIDSINPDLIPGSAGEGELAAFVAGWLRDAGLEVDRHDAAPGRPNVVAIARGSGGGRTLLLNAHMDTVGVAGMDAPFDPRIVDGRLHGRGAGDMKGSLAAIMTVGAAVAREPLRGDVIVAAVADEEVGSLGTEELVRRHRADAAIVAEPTDEVVAVAHKGFVAFVLETEGVAAHGSRPDLGVDAIAAMGSALTGIAQLDAQLRQGAPAPLLGTGSLHASVIEGGQEYSSYPARCVLRGERRTVPGESVEHVRAELQRLAEAAGAELSVPFSREPFAVDPGEPVVRALLGARATATVGGVPFWTDAALLQEAGIPTVVHGPVVGGIHGVEEWVDLASLERCRNAYLAVARELCG